MHIGPIDCDALRDGDANQQDALKRLAEERRRSLKRLRSDLDFAIEEFDALSTPEPAEHYRFLGDVNIAVNSYEERCRDAMDEAVNALTGVNMKEAFAKLLPKLMEGGFRGVSGDMSTGELYVVTDDNERIPIEEVLPEAVEIVRSLAGLGGEDMKQAFSEVYGGGADTIEGIGSFDDLPVLDEDPETSRDFDGNTE